MHTQMRKNASELINNCVKAYESQLSLNIQLCQMQYNCRFEWIAIIWKELIWKEFKIPKTQWKNQQPVWNDYQKEVLAKNCFETDNCLRMFSGNFQGFAFAYVSKKIDAFEISKRLQLQRIEQ